MVETETPPWPERYLSVAWNNALTAALAVPMLVYALVVLTTSALSDRAAFIGMTLIGAVY